MMSPREKIEQLAQEIGNFLSNMEQDPELAVHGIRKRTKFIRALLKLSPEKPDLLNEKMKTLSSLVAPFRDSKVMLDTYLLLLETTDGIEASEAEDDLRQSPHILQALPQSATIETMHNLLFDFNLQLKVNRLDISPDIIHDMIEKSFGLARKYFHLVLNSSGHELVHSWRKKSKRLWYQLRLIYGDDLEGGEHPLVLSDSLGSTLGTIHDLDVLRPVLETYGNDELILVLDQQRHSLYEESLVLGEHLFTAENLDLDQLGMN